MPSMNFTIADQVFYSTVNLSLLRGEKSVGSGTGFFWQATRSDEAWVPLIVTNRHVIEGCDGIVVLCHIADETGVAPSGKIQPCLLRFDPNRIVGHPDQSVDLCAIAFAPTFKHALDRGHRLFFKTLDPSLIPSQESWNEFDSIEDLIMVGCPHGLFDEINNLPIARRGITATPLNKRYGGRDEFMVDMACFPGSSGSPVFLMPTSRLDRETGNLLSDQRFYLVGVLYGGPVIANEGKIVLCEQPRVVVDSMMHLGQVIRSTALLQLNEAIRQRADEHNVSFDIGS